MARVRARGSHAGGAASREQVDHAHVGPQLSTRTLALALTATLTMEHLNHACPYRLGPRKLSVRVRVRVRVSAP